MLKNKTKEIIVFGCGQLGHYLKDNLKINGYKVSLVCSRIDKPLNLECCNLAYVINTAAKTNLDWCEDNKEETMKVNYWGAENVSNFAKQNGAHLIHISSEQCENPVNVYALSKLMAEKSIKRSNYNSTILRVSWLYGGERKEDKNFVKTVYNRLISGEKLFPGTDKSWPTHCDVVSKFIETMILFPSKTEFLSMKPFDETKCNTFRLRDPSGYLLPISKKQYIEKISNLVGIKPQFSSIAESWKAQRPSEDLTGNTIGFSEQCKKLEDYVDFLKTANKETNNEQNS